MSLFSSRPKIATEDYEAASLPKNRREVFSDVCHLHWGKLLLLGLLLLLFALPILLCGIYRDMTLLLLEEQVEQRMLDGTDAVALARQLNLFCAVVSIFLLILFSISLAGAMRIIKRYAWLENVSFAHDFIEGIRQNVKQYATLLAIAGGLALMCIYSYHTMPLISGGVLYDVAAYIPAGLFIVFILPLIVLMVPCIAVYDNKLRLHFRYGMLLFLKYNWRVLLLSAACFSPAVLMLIPKLIFRVIGGITVGLLLPFSLLAWFLLTSKWLDQEINREYYPQLLNKGLLGLEGEKSS